MENCLVTNSTAVYFSVGLCYSLLQIYIYKESEHRLDDQMLEHSSVGAGPEEWQD